MASETKILKDVISDAVRLFALRLFRNNVGMGWVGKARRIKRPETVNLNPGDVVIPQARPLHAGLLVGSGDAIGIYPMRITAAMVGKMIGIFASVETKKPITGEMEEAQESWHEFIQENGGLSVIAREITDVEKGIANYINNLEGK